MMIKISVFISHLNSHYSHYNHIAMVTAVIVFYMIFPLADINTIMHVYFIY